MNAHDVTERKMLELDLRHQALHDGLTLLPNAEYFRTRVDNALVRVRQHEDIAALIPDQLNKVPGVLSTETHIAFRTYSSIDLEAAFSLGVDG